MLHVWYHCQRKHHEDEEQWIWIARGATKARESMRRSKNTFQRFHQLPMRKRREITNKNNVEMRGGEAPNAKPFPSSFNYVLYAWSLILNNYSPKHIPHAWPGIVSQLLLIFSSRPANPLFFILALELMINMFPGACLPHFVSAVNQFVYEVWAGHVQDFAFIFFWRGH